MLFTWPIIATGAIIAVTALLFRFKRWVKLDNDGPMNEKVATDYANFYSDCRDEKDGTQTDCKGKERNDNSSALAGVYYVSFFLQVIFFLSFPQRFAKDPQCSNHYPYTMIRLVVLTIEHCHRFLHVRMGDHVSFCTESSGGVPG